MKSINRLTFFAMSLLLITGCSWTKNISVSTNGDQGDGASVDAAISDDGRYVAFRSFASNLVAGDTNAQDDIFLHDLVEGTTIRVNVDSAGSQANGPNSFAPSISDDGRYIAFRSTASNLVANDTNNQQDVFVRDTVNGTTTRVSVDTAGNEGNDSSVWPAISGDGRYVAFQSNSNNLVANDTNNQRDIFVRDTVSGTTTRVSVDTAGNQSDGLSDTPAISDDGRYVAFQSRASNLVANDTNGLNDIFVHDTVNGTTTRVSVDTAGNEGDGVSLNKPAISADGRYVAFESFATNLVANDTNGQTDIFVRDTVSGTTIRVNVDSSGTEGNGYSADPGISDDGRYVSFLSAASNLVVNDTNGAEDIFVRDTVIGTTSRVSLDALGVEADDRSLRPSISADGRYVVFETSASNLVPNDTNGFQDIVIRSIPNVTVTDVTPDFLPTGDTTSVTISGAYFLPGATVGIGGSGKSFSNVVIVNENTITADISVDSGATTGARSLVVALPGTGPGASRGVVGSCNGCLTIGAAPLFCPTAVLDDGNFCTIDSCDESQDTVLHTPDISLCDDGNVCTDDTCDALTGCFNVPNTLPCDDGNACTINDTCAGGSCTAINASAGTVCDDGDEFTENDACNGSGTCAGNPI